MTLYARLAEILSQPSILPDDPKGAILGPVLLERVREHLPEYSDNSIRQTFSALAADSTSPIARVEPGYGYYRRRAPESTSEPSDSTRQPPISTSDDASGRSLQHEEKFRSLYLRHARFENRYPMHVEHVRAAHQAAGVNKWKFPDVVVLDWEVGEQRDDGFFLDRALLEVKRSLGQQPFRLSSVELKVELSLSNFRQYFFQCVSNSKWAHVAELAVATTVSDSLLLAELRRLGASYGVSISHFGLSAAQLNALPSADKILTMPEDDFEQLAIAPVTIAAGAPRGDLDWDHIRDMRTQSTEFQELFSWLARCLRDAKPYSVENFLALQKIERDTG